MSIRSAASRCSFRLGPMTALGWMLASRSRYPCRQRPKAIPRRAWRSGHAGPSTSRLYGAERAEPGITRMPCCCSRPRASRSAVLDIADRVTDGRPYDYAAGGCSRDGAATALGPPAPPQVCLSCVRRGTPVAVASASVPTNAVDCSNASLTDSFCGVNSGSVSITSAPPAAPMPQQVVYQSPAPVYVPYYVPLFVHGGRRRFESSLPPAPPAPRPSAAAAFPIAPRLVVPSTGELRSLGGRRH